MGRFKDKRKEEGPTRVIIMGAGGRDFHNFNTFYRTRPSYEVVAFTAAQIPYIENRIYPPELAGPNYPEGIPIRPENELVRLIKDYHAHQVAFSYSDISHEELMDKASLVLAEGADFFLLGPRGHDDSKPSSGHFGLRGEDRVRKVRYHKESFRRIEGERNPCLRDPPSDGLLRVSTRSEILGNGSGGKGDMHD